MIQTTLHAPAIAPHRDGWGVFCLGCSEEEREYVYPCKKAAWTAPEVVVDRKVITKIMELHPLDDDHTMCTTCMWEWPCPTAQVVTGA